MQGLNETLRWLGGRHEWVDSLGTAQINNVQTNQNLSQRIKNTKPVRLLICRFHVLFFHVGFRLIFLILMISKELFSAQKGNSNEAKQIGIVY